MDREIYGHEDRQRLWMRRYMREDMDTKLDREIYGYEDRQRLWMRRHMR